VSPRFNIMLGGSHGNEGAATDRKV